MAGSSVFHNGPTLLSVFFRGRVHFVQLLDGPNSPEIAKMHFWWHDGKANFSRLNVAVNISSRIFLFQSVNRKSVGLVI